MKCEYNTGPIYGSEKSSKKASLAPLIGTGGTGYVLRLGPGHHGGGSQACPGFAGDSGGR
jgi:hypothetical protein